MVCAKSEVKGIIEEYIRHVKKKIPLEKVILFGSYAYGRPKAYSDIDVAIISPKFRKMSDIKRIMLLSDISRKINTPKDICIDPLGFTSKELDEADYFDIAAEIREKGVVFQ